MFESRGIRRNDYSGPGRLLISKRLIRLNKNVFTLHIMVQTHIADTPRTACSMWFRVYFNENPLETYKSLVLAQMSKTTEFRARLPEPSRNNPIL